MPSVSSQSPYWRKVASSLGYSGRGSSWSAGCPRGKRRGARLLTERKSGLGHLTHPPVDELQLGAGELWATPNLAEVPARRDRMVDREPRPREQLFECGRQQEGQGATVNAHPEELF